ncbi:2-dehydropantoate 2-reductase [Parendozoicomonas haliclonae]|uniref:2-dehydropantoate 2-reductase n=1 Tax=Parendozoicomonas haliclonae TaxID=1960125 RepID=A0A1X7ANV0_9GAMM|nr:2-dehydropantoate 2-reductase [Parendozoicomonas haliclonae]SMA49759.1 2-dehydropantoate 2-reductase [Parendozoicomonas haliclonae]
MKHLVFGAGLIGGYLGANLLLNGQTVDWVVRPATREKLAKGLRITDYAGNSAELNNLTFFDPQNSAGQYPDVLWLTVKCTALEKAIPDIQACMGKNTMIICLQNGLGAESFVQSHFPEHTVIRGVFAANIAELEPGHLHRGTEGGIDLPTTPKTQALLPCFQKDSLPLALHNDLEALLWAKLQLNLNNPINALSNIPLKEQLSQRGYRRVLAAAQQELLRVTKAKGLELPKLTKLPPHWLPTLLKAPDWLFTRLASAMLAIDPKARSSMWSDLSSGRITEIDYLNGAVAEEAAKLGFSSPANEALTRLVHDVEQGKGSTGLSSHELLTAVGL